MPTITVKNIPTDLYEKLKQSAEVNRRSINREVIVCIERAMTSQLINPEETLAVARKLRETTAGYSISDDDFTRAKTADRP